MTQQALSFDARVTQTCRSSFIAANDLADALQSCAGLFPTYSVERFNELDPEKTRAWLHAAEDKLLDQRSYEQQDASFLLSTWSFSKLEIGTIASLLSTPSKRVCLLGAPSLAKFLPNARDGVRHLLVDLRIPEPPVESVASLKCDINLMDGEELKEAFDLCFLDPPWHLDSYLKWIELAATCVGEKGTVAFPLMGDLTKPSAASDRQIILQHCRDLGFNIDIRRSAVLYDSPEFEVHMLRRAGIPPVNWKRADLVTAIRNDSAQPQKPVRLIPPVPAFKRVRTEPITFEIVLDRYVANSAPLISIPDSGYWMHTPSRREPDISRCNVFTSNGAKFVSERPLDLYMTLAAIEHRSGAQKVLAEIIGADISKEIFEE